MRDIFELEGIETKDHIWPIAKDGSSAKKNIQKLTEESNGLKGDKTKGKINGYRFSVIEIGRSKSKKKIGQMKVLKNGNWI